MYSSWNAPSDRDYYEQGNPPFPEEKEPEFGPDQEYEDLPVPSESAEDVVIKIDEAAPTTDCPFPEEEDPEGIDPSRLPPSAEFPRPNDFPEAA